jgi:thymidylate synthase (FAD)
LKTFLQNAAILVGTGAAVFFSSVVVAVLLGAYGHFLRLRDHDHAQYEVRVYAQAMRKLIESIVPVSVKAFQETAE